MIGLLAVLVVVLVLVLIVVLVIVLILLLVVVLVTVFHWISPPKFLIAVIRENSLPHSQLFILWLEN